MQPGAESEVTEEQMLGSAGVSSMQESVDLQHYSTVGIEPPQLASVGLIFGQFLMLCGFIDSLGGPFNYDFTGVFFSPYIFIGLGFLIWKWGKNANGQIQWSPIIHYSGIGVFSVIAIIIGVMIAKQFFKKKKEPVFQNTENIVETKQNQSDEIDDIKLDSEYVNNTDESKTRDDTSITSTDDPEEK